MLETDCGQGANAYPEPSLYWYDLETFGLDPVWDRPAQFAGVRTDLELNVLEPPRVIFCQPPADYLPDPYSCLVTGITPQFAHQQGVREADFVGAIRAEFLRPSSCVVGYNNIRFDDEVMRHTLYRNLFDPYEREWRNGNSRWDIIDMVRLVRALRPEGLIWPITEEGRPTFRLDTLTVANGIPHREAHDALADVRATIAVARLVRTAQPRLYGFVFEHRVKEKAAALLKLGKFEPVVHASGKYPTDRHCLAVVVAIAGHPTNRNGVLVYDLGVDPTPLIELDVEEIRRRVFTSTLELGENRPRIPLKVVHVNKCPVLAPIKVLRPSDYLRLGLEQSMVFRHLETIRQLPGVARKVSSVFEETPSCVEGDPDALLYQGGFLGKADREALERTRAPEGAGATLGFTDRRLPEMVFRFRARNYPEALTAAEAERWEAYRINRLTASNRSGIRVLSDYERTIDELEGSNTLSDRERHLLDDLRVYGRQLVGRNPEFLPYT